MQTDAQGRQLIEDFEGLFLQAYDDHNDHIVRLGERVLGTLTIGYGHTSVAGPPRVYVGQTITKEEADSILSSDLASVEIEVMHLVKRQLTQYEFNALVSFQYNTGWLAHHNCSLLNAVNAKRDTVAEADFMLYDRASGQVLAGLVRRRNAERLMYAGKIDEALAMAKS